MDACTQKKLRDKKTTGLRGLIQRRDLQGLHIRRNRYDRRDGAKRPLTSDALVHAGGGLDTLPTYLGQSLMVGVAE